MQVFGNVVFKRKPFVHLKVSQLHFLNGNVVEAGLQAEGGGIYRTR